MRTCGSTTPTTFKATLCGPERNRRACRAGGRPGGRFPAGRARRASRRPSRRRRQRHRPGRAASRAPLSASRSPRRSSLNRGKARGVDRSFRSITGVSAQLTGSQILELAHRKGIVSITLDAPVHVTSSDLSNDQLWPYVSGVASFWPYISSSRLGLHRLRPPGADDRDRRLRHRRGARRLRRAASSSRSLSTSLPNNSPGDGRGHGTFVAEHRRRQRRPLRRSSAGREARLARRDRRRRHGHGRAT